MTFAELSLGLDEELLVSLTRLCVAAWGIVSTTEWLAIRKVFSNDALLTWNLMRLRPGRFYQSKAAKVIFSYEVVTAVLLSRLAAAVALVFLSSPIWVLAAAVVMFVSSVFVSSRANVGGDGSDQMGVVITLGLSLMQVALLTSDTGVMLAAVLLLGGQGILAYLVSGVAKLISPTWRSGAAVVGVMNTRTYGHSAAIALIERSKLAAPFVCWLVVATEVLFPLVLFLPAPQLYFALVAAALFHLSNAFFMGLNTFVPSFLGTYPSLIVLNHLVRQATS